MAMYYYATRWFSERSLAPPRRHRSRQQQQPPPPQTPSAASTPPPSPQQRPPVAKPKSKPKKSETASSSSNQPSSKSPSPQPPSAETQNPPIYEQANGPLDPLLAKMVPKDDYFPDRAFLFAFLLSARLFVQPHELLRRISRLCEPKKGSSAGHWVRLLAEWTAAFPYDFRDERVMAQVRQLTQRCVTQEPHRRVQVSLLLQTLLERLTSAEQYEQFVQKSAASKVDSLQDLQLPDFEASSGGPVRMARALAALELERLSFVGPEEFVQTFAREAPHLAQAPFRDAKRTSTNLENYADWFDRLAALVATHVLKHSEAADRSKEIEFWTRVAHESVHIGNLNSAMAVVAAFEAIAQPTLTDALSEGQSVELDDLRRLSKDDEFYKTTMAAAAAKAKKERQTVVVPCFSIILRELFALNRSCCERLPNGQVNFDKFTELAEKMSELMVWTRAKCPFEKDQGLSLLLQTSPVLSPKGLEEVSSALEKGAK
ncbi:ras-GEF domain-containing family member 1B-like isoform X2 [Neocloeon triangulifer]|uniref:ras-GEF domain-containing family member 1B-like isoform X2 n=1 Tax=Neocloeon triangulifer TaxID=2078957 RepID=UPI00286ECAFA|nr:ras-GEF domain-containing family member 1B-like isoform X2 [Neocloeon triangulifer]